MSADNWRICPQCKATIEKQREAREAKLERSYGKVPVEKFLSLREEIETHRDEEPKETLREDFSIRVDSDGIFRIEYRASCNCGFEFEFNYEQPTTPTPRP